MKWEFSWVAHKRDMRGKNHLYGLIQTDDQRYFRLWGECKSARIHLREEFFGYGRNSRITAKNKLDDGYKMISTDKIKTSFPDAYNDIGMQFAMKVLKDNV